MHKMCIIVYKVDSNYINVFVLSYLHNTQIGKWIHIAENELAEHKKLFSFFTHNKFFRLTSHKVFSELILFVLNIKRTYYNGSIIRKHCEVRE